MALRTSTIDPAIARRHPAGRSLTACRRGGFSVAEGLIASTILAIAVVGIAGPLGAASEQGKLLRERATALVLARELMEEIAAKPLLDGGTSCHQGPESGETSRALYDSADDYHNYHDATSELRDLSGHALGFSGDGYFNRDVTVTYRTTPAGADTTSGDFGVATVTVTTPHKLTVKITRLLCKETLTY
jgi:hypothetical protein